MVVVINIVFTAFTRDSSVNKPYATWATIQKGIDKIIK